MQMLCVNNMLVAGHLHLAVRGPLVWLQSAVQECCSTVYTRSSCSSPWGLVCVANMDFLGEELVGRDKNVAVLSIITSQETCSLF